MARVTFTDTNEARKTSITLQDGCFGAGALMRIAAMFVRPEQPRSVDGSSDMHLQAAPVLIGAAAKTHALPEAAPLPRFRGLPAQKGRAGLSLLFHGAISIDHGCLGNRLHI